MALLQQRLEVPGGDPRSAKRNVESVLVPLVRRVDDELGQSGSV
jgi:hypothetical protein